MESGIGQLFAGVRVVAPALETESVTVCPVYDGLPCLVQGWIQTPAASMKLVQLIAVGLVKEQTLALGICEWPRWFDE